ncbi:MAG: hypothetical protein ACI857_000227 [Arenicella sp.]|jgi:hypothetical protein
MKRFIGLIFISFCWMNVNGQTVLNPSMETKHPTAQLPDAISMNNALDWYMTYNSSDWLSTQNGYSGHPFYDPKTGNSHSGLAGLGANGFAYREFITGTITGLIAGTTYNFSFHTKYMGDSGNLQKIGAYFSNSIPTSSEIGPIPYVKQLNPQIEQVVPINGQYNKIEGCFTANSSGTYYVTIGCFDPYDTSIEGQELNYFAIDDASISIATGQSPVSNIDIQNEFCAGQPINADGSTSGNYDSYEWIISNQNESLVYFTSGETVGTIGGFNVSNAMFSAGFTLNSGECYKLTLRLHKNGGCVVENSSVFCVVSPPNLSIFDNGEPHCEGEQFNIQTDGSSGLEYTWSTGDIGVGLTSINPIANTGITTYSVTASNPSAPGCGGAASMTIEVHSNNNQAPYFLNPPDKLYVQMGDEVCVEFYSSDSPNEEVSMTLLNTSITPSPENLTLNPNLDGELLSGVNDPHESKKWCFEWSNFNDYGEYNIPILLEDNNVCSQGSFIHQFKIDVLCPSCPEILYVDYRNPTHYPFLGDESVDAAKEIYVGTIDLQAGHEVDPGNHNVIFTAQEIYIAGLNCTNCEIVPASNSCSDYCHDCCSENHHFTYDALPEEYLLSPNNDGNNDVFFMSDLQNQFNAYNATRWRFELWPKSIIGNYQNFNKIYYQESFNLFDSPDFPFDHCFTFETPTTQHPYETFYWDGFFNQDAWGWSIDGYDYYQAGAPAKPRKYRYRITLFGCVIEEITGNNSNGHVEEIIGFIDLENWNIPPFNGMQLASDSTLTIEVAEQMRISQENEEVTHVKSKFDVYQYPNPAKEIVLFKIFNGSAILTMIAVKDAAGKTVLIQKENTQGEIDLSGLERGLYYVTYTNGDDTITKKMVLH